jgi:tyrosine-protein phosphatase SIW14
VHHRHIDAARSPSAVGRARDRWRSRELVPRLARSAPLRAAHPEGPAGIAHFGIQSIVNLRKYHSDQTAIAGTSLSLIEVPVGAGNLTYDQLVAALKAVAAAAKPTCVHCWHGSDRTGAVIAAWRIAVEGWTPAEALDEMVAGGYGHSVWFTNLRELIGGLDADRLRADAGIAPR